MPGTDSRADRAAELEADQAPTGGGHGWS